MSATGPSQGSPLAAQLLYIKEGNHQSMHPLESSAIGWLRNEEIRRLFSRQLRSTGQNILREVRARQFPPGFARLLLEALRAPGKLLGRPLMRGAEVGVDDLRGWALSVCLVGASVGEQQISLLELPQSFWRRIGAAAAAAEFMSVSLDVIDDVQDGDSKFVQRIGVPLAVNVGVALLELAPLALNHARAAGWLPPIADAALDEVHIHLLTSLGGQYLDLRFEERSTIAEAQVLEMTGRKSGTLVALIYRLGAMAAISETGSRDAAYLDAMGHLGYQMGVWFQLVNDLRDAEQALPGAQKSDRQRHKKTLPLLLAKRGMIEGTHPAEEQQSLRTQAALSYTYVAAETARLRAQTALRSIEQQYGSHRLLWPLLLSTWEQI